MVYIQGRKVITVNGIKLANKGTKFTQYFKCWFIPKVIYSIVLGPYYENVLKKIAIKTLVRGTEILW